MRRLSIICCIIFNFSITEAEQQINQFGEVVNINEDADDEGDEDADDEGEEGADDEGTHFFKAVTYI